MNIYTLTGKIIICDKLEVGCHEDNIKANNFLELGKKYTVLKTVVGKTDTKVYLEEINNVTFSPLHFRNEKTQSISEDKIHPDYKYLHSNNVLK